MDENEMMQAEWAYQQDPSTLGPYDLSLRQKYIDMFGLGGQTAPAQAEDPRYSGLYHGSKTVVPDGAASTNADLRSSTIEDFKSLYATEIAPYDQDRTMWYAFNSLNPEGQALFAQFARQDLRGMQARLTSNPPTTTMPQVVSNIGKSMLGGDYKPSGSQQDVDSVYEKAQKYGMKVYSTSKEDPNYKYEGLGNVAPKITTKNGVEDLGSDVAYLREWTDQNVVKEKDGYVVRPSESMTNAEKDRIAKIHVIWRANGATVDAPDDETQKDLDWRGDGDGKMLAGVRLGSSLTENPQLRQSIGELDRAGDELRDANNTRARMQFLGAAAAIVGGAFALSGMAAAGTGATSSAAAGGAIEPLELGMSHSADLAAAGGSEVASGSGLTAWQSGALGGSGGAPASSAAAATTAGMTGLGLPAGAVAGTAGLIAAGAGAGAGLGGALTSGGAMGLLGDVLPSVVGAGASIYGYKEYADAMKEAARLQVEQADRALAAQQQALQQSLQLQQQAVAQGRQDIAAQLQPQIQALQQGVQNAMAQYQQAATQAEQAVGAGYTQAEQTMRGVAGDVDARSQILARDIGGIYGQAGQQARTDLGTHSQAAQALYGQGMQNYLSQLGQGAQQARTDIGAGYQQAGQTLQTGEQDFLNRLGAGAQQARTDIGAGYQQALGSIDPYASGARQAYDAALQGALNPNSELYRLQQEDLEKSINRQMAARGMYGSGAALELQANQMRRLAAEEAQRRYDRQVQMSQILPQAAQAQSGLYQQQGQQLSNLAMQQGQLGAGAAQQFGMARADLGAQQGQQLGNVAMQQGQLGAGALERGYGAQAGEAARYGGQLADLGMQTAQMQGAAQQAIGLGNIGTQAQVGMGLGEMAGQKGIDLARIYASLGQQAGSEQAALSRNLASIYGDYGTNMANIQTTGAAAQQRALQGAADATSNIYQGLGSGLAANRADRATSLGNMWTNLGQYGSSALERVFGPKPQQKATGLYPYS